MKGGVCQNNGQSQIARETSEKSWTIMAIIFPEQ